MIEEAADLQQRIAYLDQVRQVARLPRTIGFACCLVGVILLVWVSQSYAGGAHSPFGYTALAVIGVGWLLFAYSFFARIRFQRAHPFKPEV